MANVFISYSRKDKDAARKLTEAFKGQDLDFWIDWEGIEPTVDWWREIEKGIEGADNFLFLISPDSASSSVCKREIEHAAKNGKRLIPVVVREIKADESPEELRPLNWIFLREADDFETAFARLITAVKTDYEWVQTHRRLQVKALEWQRGGHENSFLLRGKDLQIAESQLAVNSSKEPHPTDLQREYVLRSRQASDRQRRRIVSVSIGAAVIMAGLAVFGFAQAKLATDRANIALARQLAAQAQSIYTTGNSKQDIGVLLAVHSMQIFPLPDAAEVLQNNTLAYSVASTIYGGDVVSVAFGPDGKFILSSGCDRVGRFTYLGVEVPSCEEYSTRVSETKTGKEVTRMTSRTTWPLARFSPDGKHVIFTDRLSIRVSETNTGKEISSAAYDHFVSSVAFSSDGNYVVSSDCDKSDALDVTCSQNNIRVREAATGREVARMIHNGLVVSVAFSPDGVYVMSTSHDLTTRVWEVTTGTEVARIIHNNSPYYSTAFSPDSKYFVTTGDDNTVRVWEIASGREVAHITHDRPVTVIAFSPDGEYVVSGGEDNTARLWELSTGGEVARMTHNGGVTVIAFSPDGKYIVSGSWDNTARIWEAGTGKEVARMTHDDQVTSVAFSADGKYVLSGSGDHTARMWDSSTGVEVTRMTYVGDVSSVAFSPNGQYAVSGGCDRKDRACTQGSARVWETSVDRRVVRPDHEVGETSVAFSPDGNYAASGGCDSKGQPIGCTQGSARVWEIATGKEVARMIHDGNVNSVAFSLDGRYVVSGSDDHTARVWESTTGKEISRLTNDGSVKLVALSPDGKYVLSIGGDDDARVWETVTGLELAYIADFFHTASSVAFSPDGKYFVVGSYETASVWETTTGKEIARRRNRGQVNFVAFSPNGEYVISSGSDENIAPIWDAASGVEVSIIAYEGGVTSAAFSPDSKYIVSGGCDLRDEGTNFCIQGSARVWETSTGQEVASNTYDGDIFSVAFSPDGKYVVSGGEDNIAHVWEAITGKEVASMPHEDEVTFVAFPSDKKYVLSRSSDKTVHAWIYRPEDLTSEACSRVTRNLSRAEWKQYIGDAPSYQAICPNLPIEPEITATQ